MGSDWPVTLAERLNGFWRQHGLGKTVCRIGLDEADRMIRLSVGEPGESGLVGADFDHDVWLVVVLVVFVRICV